MSGILLDTDSTVETPTIKVGSIIHGVYRGEIQGVENIDDHVVYALVMAPPLSMCCTVDLDKHPELVEGQPSTNKTFLSAFGG